MSGLQRLGGAGLDRALRRGLGDRAGRAAPRRLGRVHLAAVGHGMLERAADRGIRFRHGHQGAGFRGRSPRGQGAGMKTKKYEKTLEKLQVELCHLQEWVKEKKLRVVIVFEGRDGAGKGGTIRALTERVSPRVFRVVALPAPSDREKSQIYMQRYMQHFPARGEIVIFDRSWYNRLGVERVMGFATDEQYERFLDLCPKMEQYLVEGGTILIKLW